MEMSRDSVQWHYPYLYVCISACLFVCVSLSVCLCVSLPVCLCLSNPAWRYNGNNDRQTHVRVSIVSGVLEREWPESFGKFCATRLKGWLPAGWRPLLQRHGGRADSNLFGSIISNPHDVLRCLCRESPAIQYNLRSRWSSGDWCCHWRTRTRFAPGTPLHRCSDLGQVVNLSLSVA